MRQMTYFALCLILALPLRAEVARADDTMSLGIYLWTDPDHDPVRAQFLSIAAKNSEIEIDGPDGTKSDSHPTTADEQAQMLAALKEQIATLSLTSKPAPTGPYVTVDWHYSTDLGYADGSTIYALDAIPATVLTLQKTAFGASYEK